MTSHHHHSGVPAVAAALLGGAAALVGYLVTRDQTTRLVSQLHDEMHANVERGDHSLQALTEAVGRNFMGAAAGQQHLADGVNALTERLNETLGLLMPNRAQPGGHEPGADDG